MKTLGLLIGYWCCCFCFAFSQNITGVLVDEQNRPVAYANVILQKADSTYLSGTTTDLDGSFKLSEQKDAKLINISYIGYQTIYKKVEQNDLGVIQMLPDAQLLGEVVVKGTQPIVKREIDRLVFNVKNSPMAQGNSVMELLKQTPLVKVTDNSIGIIGKSDAKIMLNGKVSYLDNNDLVQYLNALQSDDVASIEIITTPPSKYDAGGNGGLINIITKRNPEEGWNGSARLSYIQRTYAGENVNATANYRSSKLFLSAQVRQSKNKGKIDEEYRIEQTDNGQHSITSRTDIYNNIGGDLFLEYQPSSASTLGAVYDFSYGREQIDISNYYYYCSSSLLDSLLYTKSLQDGKTNSHTLNLYYDLQFDTLGKKLGLAFNYMNHAPDKEVNFTTTNKETDNRYIVKEPDNVNYAIWTGEANLELPFSWLNIETGVKYSHITNKSDMQYYNKVGTEFVKHPGRSNKFNYEEQTVAGYVSARKKLNEYFTIQAGLRYEHTFMEGVTPNNETDDVRTDYGKFFPTVYLTYKPNTRHHFHLNYARRINRPYFRAINPFKWYTNPNNIDEGNPALKPSFADNVEFGYVFQNLSVLVYYQKEDNAYGQILSVSDDNTTYSTYKNIYNNRQFGINLSYSLNMFSWWNVYAAGNYISNKSDIMDDGYVAQNGHSFDYKISNTISFDKDRRFQLFINYAQNMPYRVGITYDRSYANFSVGMKCVFLDNNLVLNVYGNDLFRQDLVKREKISSANRQIYDNYYDSRYVRISIVYKWGNKQMKTSKKDISFNEQNRI